MYLRTFWVWQGRTTKGHIILKSLETCKRPQRKQQYSSIALPQNIPKGFQWAHIMKSNETSAPANFGLLPVPTAPTTCARSENDTSVSGSDCMDDYAYAQSCSVHLCFWYQYHTPTANPSIDKTMKLWGIMLETLWFSLSFTRPEHLLTPGRMKWHKHVHSHTHTHTHSHALESNVDASCVWFAWVHVFPYDENEQFMENNSSGTTTSRPPAASIICPGASLACSFYTSTFPQKTRNLSHK